MCPHFDNGCKFQNLYKETDLCQERFESCAGYKCAEVIGCDNMPTNALDWSFYMRKGWTS